MGVQAEFGWGPVSLFGAFPMPGANAVAAGLKAYWAERRYFVTVHAATAPDRSLHKDIFTVAAGVGSRLELPYGFYLQGSVSAPITCANQLGFEGFEPGLHCMTSFFPPDGTLSYAIPDASLALGFAIDRSTSPARPVASPFHAAFLAGLLTEGLILAALLTSPALLPVTVVTLLLRPVVVTLAAAWASGRFDGFTFIRGALAFAADIVGLGVLGAGSRVHPMNPAPMLAATTIRNGLTPFFVSWEPARHPPPVALRF